jgi:hypothetical protein
MAIFNIKVNSSPKQYDVNVDGERRFNINVNRIVLNSIVRIVNLANRVFFTISSKFKITDRINSILLTKFLSIESKIKMYSSIGISLHKFISNLQSKFKLTSSVIATLIKSLSLEENKLSMKNSVVNLVLYRLRKLTETDSMSIGGLDNIALEDVDYITIE